MTDALVALAAGRAEVPPKPAVHTLPGSFANAMPAAWPERGLLGCKWISIFPDNPALGPLHRVRADGRQRRPHRYAARRAARGRAHRRADGCRERGLRARPGARGDRPGGDHRSGVQARSHLRVLDALGCHDVVLYARREQARDDIAVWASAEFLAVRLRLVDSPAGAVTGAAVVITALSIGVEGALLDPAWVRDDALLLPRLRQLRRSGPGPRALLAADDVAAFETIRGQRKLGTTRARRPGPVRWSRAGSPAGRPPGGLPEPRQRPERPRRRRGRGPPGRGVRRWPPARHRGNVGSTG